jgi:sensor histidine kinase YesM
MQWHDFVFSNQPRQRFLRHFIFWAAWWLYFSAIYWYNQHIIEFAYDKFIKLGSYVLLKSFLLLFIHALACYVFIYFLLPRYLLKSKWLKLTTGVFLLSILVVVTGYLMYGLVFPFVESIFNNRAVDANTALLWTSISIGLLNASKVIAAAATIKLMKYWWLKQKEKERLEKERINTELQLLKAQIRPGFLFKALNNIYAYSLAGSPRASEMLLKLSDLLSYMLYECDQPLVPLEKEIEMMKEYMALEKIRMADSLEMEIEVKGRTQNKLIAPFLLLPFIENSFKHGNAMTEKCWISLEIKVEENAYLIKLINGISPEISSQPGFYGNGLVNVQKRLNLLYPSRHELKMTAEEEVFLVILKIQLEESPSPPVSGQNEINDIETTKEQTTIYVEQ